MIHDLETSKKKVLKAKWPWKCAASHNLIAVTTEGSGLRLYDHAGALVQIVSDSNNAFCVAFHPRYPSIIALGFKDGCVRLWDMNAQSYVSSLAEHTKRITSIRFSDDGRLFLSSDDSTGSILTLGDHFQVAARVKLEGHSKAVTDILPLVSLDQCVSCGYDLTIRVWDCRTGACLRTLREHTTFVTCLALHPSGEYFASGSLDQAVVIWSCQTFEVLSRLPLPDGVQSIVFGSDKTLHVGVHEHGVTSGHAFSGEIGSVIIPATSTVFGLALGTLWSRSFLLLQLKHALALT